MPNRKVLFFGITGIGKKAVLGELAKWCQTERFRTCKIFDFEEEFLKPTLTRYFTFLDSELADQYTKWQSAWIAFLEELAAYEKQNHDHDIFLMLHGCLTRPLYGARTLVQPEQVAKFAASHIVTFLDNVYDMWWRTQQRAGGEAFRGMPTLQDLLLARQVETLIADQVALASGFPRRCRHLVLAVHHPVSTLGNWLYTNKPKVVYLCFPISDPRKLLERGDRNGINEINDFLSEAYRLQAKKNDRVLVCPLAIDELPLVKASKDTQPGQTLVFDRETLRWNIAPVFGDGSALLSPEPLPKEKRCAIPVDGIGAAAATIRNDVTRRDYRLVDQADCVAAFCPKFRPQFEISAGCRREIDHASQTRGMPVYIYQNPEYDPNNELRNDLSPEVGSMGRTLGEMRIVWQNSVAQMFSTI